MNRPARSARRLIGSWLWASCGFATALASPAGWESDTEGQGFVPLDATIAVVHQGRWHRISVPRDSHSANALRVARLEEGHWTALPGRFRGRIHALLDWDGRLIAAGRFAMLRPPMVEDLARWDGKEWAPLPGDLSFPTRRQQGSVEVSSMTAWQWEMVAEHYPGRGAQYSPTFSLIWVSLLRDFAWWRDDPAFVRERLLGMRGVLEHFRTLRGSSGLLEHLAGWPFVDWVPAWQTGNAPEGVKGISSINNLFFVQALRHAAEVEDAYGDPAMAVRKRALGDELSREIIRRFWVTERSLLADDEQHKHFSEHAPCLAARTQATSTSIISPTRPSASLRNTARGPGSSISRTLNPRFQL